MDPVEAGDWLSGRPHQLVLLTGLDPANRPVHNALLAAFYNRTSDRPPLKVRPISGDLDLPQKGGEKKGRGILRRAWPNKYLDQVPALIVLFMDLDWDHPSWPEKLQEAGSKVESLRNSIHHGSKLVVVLLQERSLPSLSEDTDRASEFCHHCQLTSKQLFVIPIGGDLHGYVHKLETAFHEHAQAFYQTKIKTIRARSIPNNSTGLLVRQLFKLAFLSELRQDTHTALRNYKLAYEHCQNNQGQWEVTDLFEWRSVVGLINYKMCELNFLHSTARDAITHMNKHMSAFFYADPGTYPTPQLAAIEYALWKSKQCWQFAELFERAVVNGLTAVATINPGTFLEGAATHFAQANKLIAELKASSTLNVPYPQPDPLVHPTEFFGQRPWLVKSDPVTIPQCEQSAVVALQLRLRVNHDGLMSLLTAASAQYKKYGCLRMQRKIMNECAEAQSAAGKPEEALKLWNLILREGGLPDSVRVSVLNKALWVAYSNALVKETMWALVQLLQVQSDASRDPLLSVPLQDAFSRLSAGEIPSSPFGQMTDHQIQHVTAAWQKCLAEPQFFTVPCSRLLSFLKVSACFLHPEPVALDGRVPVRVSLTLLSHSPITFSGLRVSGDNYDATGRRLNAADEPSTFNVFRSNITLQPFIPHHVYFCFDLTEATKPLQDGQQLVITRVSLEIGDRSQCRVFGSFDWEGPGLTKECLNRMDPAAVGQASVRIVGLVGGLINTGAQKVDCLLAEVGTVKLRLKNDTNKAIERLRLEFKRGDQSLDASSVLFVDEENELRSELGLAVTDRLAQGEEVPCDIRLSSQLLGNIELVLESSFIVSGESSPRRGRVPILVSSQEPFTVRSQVLTTNGIPVTNVLNRSTHLLKVDLKSNADIEVTRVEWLLGDVVANASALSGSSKDLSEPDILLSEDVISYCTPIDVECEEEGADVEKPLGRMAVQWRRCGGEYPVRSIVPLCRTQIAPCPITVTVEVGSSRAEMRRPLPISYTFFNNTEEVVEITASFDLTDTFMFSGDKLRAIRLLPGVPHRVEIVVMALAAGRLSFPRVVLGSATLSESILLDALRNLPATIFVLPLSKDPLKSAA